MNDKPIIPIKDRFQKVIDLAGYKIERGSAGHSVRCKHQHLVYDDVERRIWCDDCNQTIEHYDAFMVIFNNYEKMQSHAKRVVEEANEAHKHSIISRAAKMLDKAFRKRKTTPCCPHCRRGLLAEDFAGGITHQVSREFEIARRKRDKEGKT